MNKHIKYRVSQVLSDDFVTNHLMVLYSIKNLIDGRYYIGQCMDFLNRFKYNKLWSHKLGNQYIDNSMRLHGYDNFEVTILFENEESEVLNKLEIEYIKRLHTWYGDAYWTTHKGLKQYNQSIGGKGYEHYWSIGMRSVEEREIYGDGDSAYMLHTPDVYKKSADTRAKLYGSPNACCTTPEARAKADATNRANHGGRLAWNYEGQSDDMMRTQKANHGGVLAFHTPEARAKAISKLSDPSIQSRILKSNKDNHDGVLAWHTSEARLNAIKTRTFNMIKVYIDRILSDNLEFNIETYYKYATMSNMWSIVEYLNDLKLDDRWIPEYNIFENLEQYLKSWT